MNNTAGTKLLIPGLAGFYASSGEIADALVRIVIGCIMFMHGWGKVGMGTAGVTAFFAKMGMAPELAYAAIFLETVGAVCIVVGLFTRFFAAALAIEMAIALVSVHLAHGFSASKGGYEYVLLLGIVMFAIALRGGGRYSLDRIVGREL